MAVVTGETLTFITGASLRRHFFPDGSHSRLDSERVPLLQATWPSNEGILEYNDVTFPTVQAFLPMGSLLFLFLFVLGLACYVLSVVYFWIGGVFLLLEEIAKHRSCGSDMHLWLGVALLQPLIIGLCFQKVFDPLCSRVMSWILSLGLILAGANCFGQRYPECVQESPEFYSFVQTYLVFMVVSWLLFLLLPLLPFLVPRGVFPRRVDPATLDSMATVAFDSETFCEDGDFSKGAMPIECCVCCERFGPEKIIKRTPCNHVFHQDCLARWLSVTDSCPVCRKELRKADPAEDTETGLAECLPSARDRSLVSENR